VARSSRPNPWNPLPPLLVGLCFGLAYALTFRLLEGRFVSLVRLGERFEIKPAPGLSLESLRMRYGLDRIDLNGAPAEQPGSGAPGAPLLDPTATDQLSKPGAAPPAAEAPLKDPLQLLQPVAGPVVAPPVPTFTGPALPAAPPLPPESATVVPPPQPRR
jgi:hypothetical protein